MILGCSHSPPEPHELFIVERSLPLADGGQFFLAQVRLALRLIVEEVAERVVAHVNASGLIALRQAGPVRRDGGTAAELRIAVDGRRHRERMAGKGALHHLASRAF
jgi:hypothetical protein